MGRIWKYVYDRYVGLNVRMFCGCDTNELWTELGLERLEEWDWL